MRALVHEEARLPFLRDIGFDRARVASRACTVSLRLDLETTTRVAELVSFAPQTRSACLLKFERRRSRLLKCRAPMDICDIFIGYAGVSTDDQDLRLQRAALKEAGCLSV